MMDMGRGSGTNRDHHSKIEKKIRPKDSLQAEYYSRLKCRETSSSSTKGRLFDALDGLRFLNLMVVALFVSYQLMA